MSVKRRIAAWCEKEIAARTAERIAEAIEASAPIPATLCPDPRCPVCVRSEQAQADAAIARRIGGTS